MIIRPEEPADVPAIRTVLEAAFPAVDEARLVERLRADDDVALSLVAVDGGKVVGHILFSPMAAPFRAVGLGPVAVVPERQRQGIGAALVLEGLERVQAGGWEGVFVVGDPAYYRRFGFDSGAAGGFDSPYAGPYLMVGPLIGKALPATSGPIAYAPAFSVIG